MFSHGKTKRPGIGNRLRAESDAGKPRSIDERLIADACIVLGIAAYPLAFVWQAGVAAAIIALVLGFYHNYIYGSRTRVRIGMGLAAVFCAIVILSLVLMRMYYNILGIDTM